MVLNWNVTKINGNVDMAIDLSVSTDSDFG